MRARYRFGTLVFDPVRCCLWDGARQVVLRPKECAVLTYLLAHAGHPVAADELRRAVWPDVVVGPAVVKVSIAQLRRALGDTAQAPRFIETLPTGAYRFVAAVTDETRPGLFGRTTELAALAAAATAAAAGTRRFVFVCGEPGIGKTALLEAFERTLPITVPGARVVWGRSLGDPGPPEPYGPILEALGRLCRGDDAPRCLEVLARHAPDWLTQLPGVAARERPRRRIVAAGMLRQLCDSLEALTRERLLVLCLDDLHWGDPSTLAALAALGRRAEPARLLVLGAYGPRAPLALERTVSGLELHEAGGRLLLAPLATEAVQEYVAERFDAAVAQPALVRALHARSRGNPLFLRHLATALEREGVVVCAGGTWRLVGSPARIAAVVPESLQALLTQQLRGLPPAERRIVEAAGLLAEEFSAAAVAAGLGLRVEEADRRCQALAQPGRLFAPRGMVEWPDGTVAGTYAFAHPLYRDVARAQAAPACRVAVHARVGARLAAAFGPRASEIAAVLAGHAEGAHQYAEAVQYLRAAAQTASQRQGYEEAAAYLERATALWERVPPGPAHEVVALKLAARAAASLIPVRGVTAARLDDAFARAFTLWSRLPRARIPFATCWTLAAAYTAHLPSPDAAKLHMVCASLRRATRRPAAPEDPIAAHYALGQIALMRGKFTTACRHHERAAALASPDVIPRVVTLCTYDAAAAAAVFAVVARGVLGLEANGRRALDLAREQRHPGTRAVALLGAAMAGALLQDGALLAQASAELHAVAQQYDLGFWDDNASVYRGYALSLAGAHDRALPHLRAALAVLRLGASTPYFFALLADAALRAGRAADAQAAIDDAWRVLGETRAYFGLAELWRCRAEVLLATSPADAAALGEARRCLRQAVQVARRQRALLFERRAAERLAQLTPRP
jgi:DNA-binding winged helix-turn-helix (wHTH) protein/tetratricopeptide (TPR) repeat protein